MTPLPIIRGEKITLLYIGRTNGKSDIEQRIAQIRQEQSLQAPSPCNTLNSASKQKSTKIIDICKKFLANQSSENDSITK